jgi:hypothetical protein
VSACSLVTLLLEPEHHREERYMCPVQAVLIKSGPVTKQFIITFIIIMALQPSVGPWRLFQFLDPIHLGIRHANHVAPSIRKSWH